MISEKYNTVFVHIPKTAGRSIDYVFIEAHGLTWETRAPLLLRANDDPSRGPCFLTHLFAREYVECGHLSPERFASMFKFAVVRNPYDRFISEFRWRSAEEPQRRLTIDSLWAMKDAGPFTDEGRHLARQIDFVTDRNGKIIVDEVLRFESLAEQLPKVFERIFGYMPEWRVVNQSPSAPIDRGVLCDALRREIYRRYEPDFDVFSYESGFIA
jgi:hypothetical protein